ncbi:Conserved_hypothetical protein [Hexamita inflata]|uniref:4Fe-4S ferredoxin-type domain-containing protein n=1 Tax=Hexamita inflata TaxID=28002 RepID=A0AA86U253_9EUKA|nr:Conserved hypothetical protein [Hexamita inflata]CAI9937471.1 Conserved hypothetical protein [Hexamita inflata]
MPAVATNLDNCCFCQSCNVCQYDAISFGADGKVVVSSSCVSCGACVGSCPCGVLELQ